MNGNDYLFAAYVVIWTILFAYLFFLHRRQRQVARELREVSETLERRSLGD